MEQQENVGNAPSSGYANYLVALIEASAGAGDIRLKQQTADGNGAIAQLENEENIWNSWVYHISRASLKFSMNGFQKWMSVGELKKGELAEEACMSNAYRADLAGYETARKHFGHWNQEKSQWWHAILSSALHKRNEVDGDMGNGTEAALSKLVQGGFTSHIDPSYVNYKESNVTLQQLTGHVASLAAKGSKVPSAEVQGAQAMLGRAQTSKQNATDCAQSGAAGAQKAVTNDAELAQMDLLLAGDVNAALDQAISWGASA